MCLLLRSHRYISLGLYIQITSNARHGGTLCIVKYIYLSCQIVRPNIAKHKIDYIVDRLELCAKLYTYNETSYTSTHQYHPIYRDYFVLCRHPDPLPHLPTDPSVGLILPIKLTMEFQDVYTKEVPLTYGLSDYSSVE